ncbi:MAG: L-histidine N(alpha)-methyltransferase [Bacteroidales bacterium]
MYDKEFATHVDNGLSKYPKELSSKYLYDDKGSSIFQSIMQMPEYYPSECEHEILSKKQSDFYRHLPNHKPLEFIELGAGDGKKIVPFLKYFKANNIDFYYKPIDISSSALKSLKTRITRELPNLAVNSIQDDFFHALPSIKNQTDVHPVYLFLGGNIGNFTPELTMDFLKTIRKNINTGDLLIIGFDMKKDPRIIQKAYDDPHGITASFNLNMLTRINKELEANFDINNFRHYAYYNPENGIVTSKLYSTKDQTVFIKKLNKSYHFEQWEFIHTEISRKFDISTIGNLADSAGFSIVDHIYDRKKYFTDTIFKAK